MPEQVYSTQSETVQSILRKLSYPDRVVMLCAIGRANRPVSSKLVSLAAIREAARRFEELHKTRLHVN